ncbi:type II toxin-antitoxin system VapC family toxin [Candidatus Marsarchaeota archaeon]|jgi:predicted nucleic acid-binding protein|nr:type II toxin-antitoxin system VapC family toxin [Candidatus Marsarchaeota archaeon]MCL5115456.1 type II toxin-antitoxin system VapC family toxin [Candidatus Marsarchaeota archaeon]
MTYIFDSSGIYAMMSRKEYERFADAFTIYLAKYELGNILWKERYLHKRIGSAQQKEMADNAEKVFANIEVLGISGYINDVVNLAGNLNISVYDASYVFFAMKRNAILVTADNKLIKKLSGVIGAISPAELLKQS